MTEFHDVSLSVEQLREAMRTDCLTVLSFYLEDELTLEVPDFHIEIWDELVDIVRSVNLQKFTKHLQKLFCVPRGHSKSTIVKLAVILFMRYSIFGFTVYASKTGAIAKNALKDVVAWFLSEKDQAVYGKCRQEKANDTEQLWILHIGTPDYGVKRIILKAIGADQQIRGLLIDSKRPELIVIDDCEDNDTAQTSESQNKLDVWLLGNLLKASARRSVRIMLGNMIKSTTLLARLAKDPKWNPTVFGCIIRNLKTGKLEPLWPGMYTLNELLEEYADYRKLGQGHVWIYEMMNMTADSVFKTSMVEALRGPRPNPDQVVAGIITLDPAFGKKSWHDEAALTVHVRTEDSLIPWIVESRKGRWTESEMLDNLMELSYYWNLSCWGIESQAAQHLLIPIFRTLLKERMIPPQIITMLPLPSGGASKPSRILALAKAIAAQSYGIVEEEEELFLDIEGYDPDDKIKKDDGPDSAAYGLIAWAQAGEQITSAGGIQQIMALLQNQNADYNNVTQGQLVPF